MSKLIVEWNASEKLRRGEAIETGVTGPIGRSLTFDLADLDAGLRRQLVSALPLNKDGDYIADVRSALEKERELHHFSEPIGHVIYEAQKITLDAEPTPAGLPALLQRIAAAQGAADKAHKEGMAALDKRRADDQAQRDAKAVARAVEQAEYERREHAKKGRLAAEKASWIAAHGSDHLRRAVAAGYNSQRAYVTERAAAEWPDWIVDFNDTARWDTRSFPDEAALDVADEAATRVGAAAGGVHEYSHPEVVWLTAWPGANLPDDDETGNNEMGRPREAVVVRGFLGKYDLFKF